MNSLDFQSRLRWRFIPMANANNVINIAEHYSEFRWFVISIHLFCRRFEFRRHSDRFSYYDSQWDNVKCLSLLSEFSFRRKSLWAAQIGYAEYGDFVWISLNCYYNFVSKIIKWNLDARTAWDMFPHSNIHSMDESVFFGLFFYPGSRIQINFIR